jgi:ATP phosphoribosyltransferase regulatory subunit
MGNYRFHTPDGVSDLLPDDCLTKRGLELRLRGVFASNGYLEIETPGIEFFDVYTGGKFVAQENLYKLTDQEGRILSLRYDGTVPVARLAATLYKDVEPPLRLSYLENMYRFRESGGGRQREFSQAGVELLGISSPQADAEVIALAIASALEMGITDLKIAIGQADFFRGLMEEWSIPMEDAADLSRLIDQKDTVALEKAAVRYGLSASAQKTLLMIPALYGSYETLDVFDKRVTNQRAKDALRNVRDILEILDDYGYMDYVAVDLGMLRSLDYYTGMIFKGFTNEVGFPVISGGRYDKVVSVFGRDMAAVGFSISIHLCMSALRRQGKEFLHTHVDTIIGYSHEPGMRKMAFSMAEALRNEGLIVLVDSMGLDEEQLSRYTEQKGIEQMVFLNSGNCECEEDTTCQI